MRTYFCAKKEAIVLIVLHKFFATPAVLKTDEYHSDIHQFSLGQRLVGKIRGKLHKNRSATLIPEESPLK